MRRDGGGQWDRDRRRAVHPALRCAGNNAESRRRAIDSAATASPERIPETSNCSRARATQRITVPAGSRPANSAISELVTF
jgi:hypothetical protein